MAMPQQMLGHSSILRVFFSGKETFCSSKDTEDSERLLLKTTSTEVTQS